MNKTVGQGLAPAVTFSKLNFAPQKISKTKKEDEVMKKIIAAILSAMVGLFGYTIVDTAIEARVSTLENEVAVLKSQVAEYHGTASVPTTNPQLPPSGYLEELVSEIYENSSEINMALMPPMEINLDDSDEISYYLGVSSAESIDRAVYSEPMIGAIAYSLCLVEVKDGADVDGLKKEILENIKCNKWLMVSSEKALVASFENIIILVLGTDEMVEDIYNAFNIVSDGAASAPITKDGI